MSSAAASRASIGMCFDRTFPPSFVTEVAGRLDEGGADQLWVIEDCFYTAGVSLAATALATTERLAVGIGIMPAVARNPAITAMEIATLCELAPGRFLPGIGHGVQSWMEQMGALTPSPLATLEETIVAVRRLLAGENVTMHGRHVDLDDVQLDQPPSIVPPVLAGVRGPKSLQMAGRVAGGIVLAEPASPSYVTWALEQAGHVLNRRARIDRPGLPCRGVLGALRPGRSRVGVPHHGALAGGPAGGSERRLPGAAVRRRPAGPLRGARRRGPGHDAGRSGGSSWRRSARSTMPAPTSTPSNVRVSTASGCSRRRRSTSPASRSTTSWRSPAGRPASDRDQERQAVGWRCVRRYCSTSRSCPSRCSRFSGPYRAR